MRAAAMANAAQLHDPRAGLFCVPVNRFRIRSFGGCHSIQLSYERVDPRFSPFLFSQTRKLTSQGSQVIFFRVLSVI
jgi:hypothetical protein